ncbi:Chondroitin AC alginate lyase, partial [Rhizoctonia solani]
MHRPWTLGVLGLSATFARAAFPSYPNEFVPPKVLLSTPEVWTNTTRAAQASIVKFADEVLREGPWSVMNKTVTPPSGNKHHLDLLILDQSYWPNCDGIGNTTELTQEEIYVTCPYERRDGQFNPDYRLANDSGATQALMDALLYAPIAHLVISKSPELNTAKRPDGWYASQALRAAQIFFVDEATRVNPHLNYSQLLRGPGTQVGSPTGVLDMHWWPKALSGILLMKEMGVWSEADLAGVVNWAKAYIPWLQTNELAKAERASDNNHGSYFFNQLAALQILVGDLDGAKATVQDYFTGIYMSQIDEKGDQPKESARTHPYHYRGYNLCAMINSARLAEFVGYDGWNAKSSSGAGIQTAADYAMQFTPGPGEAASELFPQIAAVAVKFGDPSGKYAAFLASKDQSYPGRPWFLWNQPLSDSGLAVKFVPEDDDSGNGSVDPDNSTAGTASNNAVLGFKVDWKVGLVSALAGVVIGL